MKIIIKKKSKKVKYCTKETNRKCFYLHFNRHVFYQMMSFPRPRDSRDFSPYSSSAEWADKDKTTTSGLSKADVVGPAVAGLAHFNGLKKEDIEEGPAVAGKRI
ncbi:hypothetical protein E2C01_076339 [Portunus trituberculatus]|uniref:Uncharacterized protein n=1 Tax=Portunus trituberculatus TaxID=210409 RepID=A0A5B7IJJ0_PORTR|nr:hypothetical protein [Portunus trituberculatus]